ncbi:hypothetical protein [Francisella philomiragia]|uniref:hypothetical protein n=1 Tax=Francisella philomiragia TaxID=28110 RepID=UPI003514884D
MDKLEPKASGYNQSSNQSPNFTLNYQHNLNIESLPIDSKGLIELNKESPKLADKVISIVEKEQASRHLNTQKQIELDFKAISFNKLNVILATGVIITIVISSTVLTILNHEILGGSVLGLSALSGIIKFFSSSYNKK